MENQKEHIKIEVYPYHAVVIPGGWAMVCPICGNHVASGTTDVKKPKWSVCNGIKK